MVTLKVKIKKIKQKETIIGNKHDFKKKKNSNTSINLTVLKVESVEVHPLYQVAERLRLK